MKYNSLYTAIPEQMEAFGELKILIDYLDELNRIQDTINIKDEMKRLFKIRDNRISHLCYKYEK